MFTTILYGFGMIWIELTRLTLFSAELPWCRFLCRNRSSRNGLKIYGDFLWTKRDPRSFVGGPEASRGSDKLTRRPTPQEGLASLSLRPGLSDLLPKLLGSLWVQKKSTKSFVVFGLCLVLISCDVENMQKNNNWHLAPCQ